MVSSTLTISLHTTLHAGGGHGPGGAGAACGSVTLPLLALTKGGAAEVGVEVQQVAGTGAVADGGNAVLRSQHYICRDCGLFFFLVTWDTARDWVSG